MTQPVAHRLGLLGPAYDAVAQLLEDLPQEAGTDFITIADPRDDADRIDRILVLDQDHALAHLPRLIACDIPCRVLLRRCRSADERPQWEDSLNLLSESLSCAGQTAIDLVALTEDAAQELSAALGLPVTPIGTLPQIPRDRPRVAIRRNEDVLTFTQTGPDGQRETRRAEREIYNWARLRRLAQPMAGDTEDLDMVDLCNFADGSADTSATRHTDQNPPCMVAIVPNGVGLGHVTRMIAIGRALQQAGAIRVVFWSYSRAAEILQAAGFEVVLRQNAVHLKAHPPSWRQWETAEFARFLRRTNARLVAHDGGSFDPYIIDALRTPGCGRIGVIWVRRGMLRAESDPQLLESEQHTDLIIEPGDLAVEMDMGPTRTRQAVHRGFSQHIESDPITLKSFLHSYSRREAKKRLKLGMGRHCLVSLGGAFGDWDALRAMIEDRARAHRVRIIWAQSPLAPPPGPGKSTTLIRRIYPLSPYMAAIDGMVTATGYNSYHELMLGFDGPVLLAPTNNVRQDDQVARASWAAKEGWADIVLADQQTEQAAVIDRFMQRVRRGETHTNRPRRESRLSEITDAIFALFERYR